jgi:hypothetical protein
MEAGSGVAPAAGCRSCGLGMREVAFSGRRPPAVAHRRDGCVIRPRRVPISFASGIQPNASRRPLANGGRAARRARPPPHPKPPDPHHDGGNVPRTDPHDAGVANAHPGTWRATTHQQGNARELTRITTSIRAGTATRAPLSQLRW